MGWEIERERFLKRIQRAVNRPSQKERQMNEFCSADKRSGMHFLYQTVLKRTERTELHAICHWYKLRPSYIRYTGAESKRRQAAVFQPYREENQKEKEN